MSAAKSATARGSSIVEVRRRSSAMPAVPPLPGATRISGRCGERGKRAHDGVLAAAAAEDEDPHLEPPCSRGGNGRLV